MSLRSSTVSGRAAPPVLRAALLVGALLLASPMAPDVAAPSGSAAAAAPEAARWSPLALAELRAAIAAAGAEGLDPADYALPADADDAAADRVALALAGDYALGHVRQRARFGWHVESPAMPEAQMRGALDRALAEGRLTAWLQGLLPASPQYRAMRAALATLPPGDPRRPALLVNMERWRWMPRDWGGERHLWVNVPAQEVRVVEGGAETARHVAVVGAPDTPTPALSATAVSVVVNPWWTVPQSMIRRGEVPTGRGAARRGYTVERVGGGVRVRQRPGPRNALGRVKIEMPNAYAIYLHDTPAKGAFSLSRRARSHGCVRVQDIEGLALSLTAEPEPIVDALADDDTRAIRLERRWPVWIVYFTLDLDASGGLVGLPDLYGRDAALAVALTGERPAPAPEAEAPKPEPTPTASPTPVRPAAKPRPRPAPPPAPEPPVVESPAPAPVEAPDDALAPSDPIA